MPLIFNIPLQTTVPIREIIGERPFQNNESIRTLRRMMVNLNYTSISLNYTSITFSTIITSKFRNNVQRGNIKLIIVLNGKKKNDEIMKINYIPGIQRTIREAPVMRFINALIQLAHYS